MPLGDTIIEQNMKLPLTTLEYYDIKLELQLTIVFIVD